MVNATIFSHGIWKIPFLSSFLPEFRLQKSKSETQVVLGWGLRPSTAKARDFAQRYGLSYVALEDGFLRSLGLGVQGYPPFSMVVDDVGIYYDTSRESRLERFILASDNIAEETLMMAREAMGQIVAHRLSKYNHAPDFVDMPSEKIKSNVNNYFPNPLTQEGGLRAGVRNASDGIEHLDMPSEKMMRLNADSPLPRKRGLCGNADSPFPQERELNADVQNASDGMGRSCMPSEQKIVLVVDQTFGDMAVQYGGADEGTFIQMFQAALVENPDAQIWVKTHPDVLCGKKKGYLTDIAQQQNVRLLAEDVHPISLLQAVDKVYCVTSQMGFEALLCGKKVVTFGLSWYAGWGVSDDRHEKIDVLKQQNRRSPRSLEQLFACAYLQYSRYINPNTGEAGTIFDVLAYLAQARRLNEKLRGDLYCVGMSLWKRSVMKPFVSVPSCRLKFVASVEELRDVVFAPNTHILAWGNGKQAIVDFARERQLPLLRMEDGFIRSVGLGSNLVPPLSLVIDKSGIYFNPEQASDLEQILQNTVFTVQDEAMACELQRDLIQANISKYNVGEMKVPSEKMVELNANSLLTQERGLDADAQNVSDGMGRLDMPSEQLQRVLLVPGQVEDDASIRYGSPKIFRNLDLLKTVRERNPDAWIIYKPHPDVVSGNRVGQIEREVCLQFANQIAEQTDILACLQLADEVHTMTSLTGFEALLRGKKVFCYGLPFYAGWGLTVDELKLERRTRKLQLWQLIAGTLLYYPCYIHPETRRMIDAKTAVQVLAQQKKQATSPLKTSKLAKQFNKLKYLFHSLRKAW